METLPGDIRREIAKRLPPSSVMSLCETEKAANKEICESQKFWRLKLIIDYPEIYEPLMNLKILDPKNTYKRTFKRYRAKIAEALKDELKSQVTSDKLADNGIYHRDLPEVIEKLEKIYEEIVALGSSKMEIGENPQVASIYEKYFPRKKELHYILQRALSWSLETEIERRRVRERLGL